MTARNGARGALLEALLDVEEAMNDLRAALTALHLIASAAEGVEKDDMVGIRFVVRHARDIADVVHGSWHEAVTRLAMPRGPGR